MTSILWRAGLRFLIRNPWQLGLAVLGIALGVAVVVAIDAARASADRAFTLSTQAVVGKATHRIIGGPRGLEESLFTRLKISAAIRHAAPVLEDHVSLADYPGETMQLLGIDPFSELSFRALRPADEKTASAAGLVKFFTQTASVLINRASGTRLGIQLGDHLDINLGTVAHRLRVVGWLTEIGDLDQGSYDDLLVTDIATAQELFGMAGRLSHIDLILAGPRTEAVLARIQRLLPPGAAVISARTRDQAVVRMTRAFQANLLALSLLAVMVGGFVVFNTMRFLVVQQRDLIGTLRTLGVRRGEVFGWILAEATLLGSAGTVLGLALGLGMTDALVKLMTRTINDVYYVLAVRQFSLASATVLKGIALGMGTTLIAAALPAYEATAMIPRLSLARSHLEIRSRRKVAIAGWVGVWIAAFGALSLGIPSGGLMTAFAALFAIVFGSALLTPALMVGIIHGVGQLLSPSVGMLLRMALRSVTAALSRTAVAAAALMLAIATTVGMGLMISDFRLSVSDWLANLLGADLYVFVSGPTVRAPASALGPELVEGIRSAPGVASVSTTRRILIEDPGEITELVAYELSSRSRAGFRFQRGDPEHIWRVFDREDVVLVSEAYAYRHGVSLGDSIRLRTDLGQRSFTLAGVYYHYGSDQGLVAMSRPIFDRYWRDTGVSSVGVYAVPGVDQERLKARIRALSGPSQMVAVKSNRALFVSSLRIFDRTFVITEVLRVLAGCVAFVGVFSALMAMQLERAHERGVLRACGVTPRQIGKLIILETAFMGLIAGIIALPVGMIIAVVLEMVVIPRSFGWVMTVHIVPSILLQGMLIGVLAAAFAALYPAWKTTRGTVADLRRHE